MNSPGQPKISPFTSPFFQRASRITPMIARSKRLPIFILPLTISEAIQDELDGKGHGLPETWNVLFTQPPTSRIQILLPHVWWTADSWDVTDREIEVESADGVTFADVAKAVCATTGGTGTSKRGLRVVFSIAWVPHTSEFEGLYARFQNCTRAVYTELTGRDCPYESEDDSADSGDEVDLYDIFQDDESSAESAEFVTEDDDFVTEESSSEESAVEEWERQVMVCRKRIHRPKKCRITLPLQRAHQEKKAQERRTPTTPGSRRDKNLRGPAYLSNCLPSSESAK